MFLKSKKFNYLFPSAFMVNTYAMTILLVVLGLADKVDLAADVGIVQGATLALFFAFSANARSLILNPASGVSAQLIMATRLILLIPLASGAYFLSTAPAEVNQLLAAALILRRCVEWLGEVHLSEMERLDSKGFAWNYLILQVILLFVVLLWFVCNFPYPLIGLFIWALTPLIMSTAYIGKSLSAISQVLVRISSRIMPNLGSTVIIGITVYVFRVLILLIVGKEAAGNLFTAFAIGGLTGGVFANALGPSVVLHESDGEKNSFPFLFSMILYLSLVLGVIFFITSILELPILAWTGKSSFFWMATGLSMIGGVVMVYAQRIRLRLLQHEDEHDVFGPDVMMNILLIAAVIFTYYLLGMQAMGGLYLLSSVLAYLFYLSSKRGVAHQQSQPANIKIRMVLAVMLLIPVFFQASSGLFRDPTINYNSGGMLVNLPVPLSVLACYAGIILLAGYKRAFISFSIIFFTCVFMIMAAIISTQADPFEQYGKIILLIQFILPMFALVLGQIFFRGQNDDKANDYEKMFLYLLAVIIPWHLVATFYQGFLYLVPSLGLFSIYQDLQYVPVVLVGSYLIALFTLWRLPRHKIILLFLAPLMAIYVAASMSLTAIIMLLVGFSVFAVFQWISDKEKLPAIVFLLVTIISFSYLYYATTHSMAVASKFGGFAQAEKLHQQEMMLQERQKKRNMNGLNMEKEKDKNYKKYLMQHEKSMEEQINILSKIEENEGRYNIKIPTNILDRLNHWRYYVEKIAAAPELLLFGNNRIADRADHPSAHNYYLDFIFNFGLIALLPFLILLQYTFTMIWRSRQKIFFLPNIIGLCFVVLFLLLIDNFFKVGLRQPYPGIFSFFLWGLLLSRLHDLDDKEKCS